MRIILVGDQKISQMTPNNCTVLVPSKVYTKKEVQEEGSTGRRKYRMQVVVDGHHGWSGYGLNALGFYTNSFTSDLSVL